MPPAESEETGEGERFVESTIQGRKVLILGVGNTLLTDEGFGVAAAGWLESHYKWPEGVTIVDGGTLGYGLMAMICDCDFLVVLDIVLGGGEPGTTYLLEGEDLRKSVSFRDSTHQTDLLDTLASCELIGHRPDAIAFGLEPFDYRTMSMGISPQAGEKLPDFCGKVVAELRKRGLAIAEKSRGD
ncbi:MAG: HyaD/HybD family hydrogenase maturation endopeptidase [Desulfovibrio sp.]|nr:HyaD/HybD family hydrogenase maturation endopeptidase [Desulfovibrio sp.]